MPTVFHYQNYEPSNTNTIAQIMGLPAQLQAQAARNIAQANADANAARMQRNGQVASAIGGGVNQAIGNVADILQAKRDAPIRAAQLETLQQNVSEGRSKLLSTQEAQQLHVDMGAAFKESLTPDGGFDLKKVQTSLIQKGHPEAALALQGEIGKLGDDWDIKDGVLFNKKIGPGSTSTVGPTKTREVSIPNPDGSTTIKVIEDTPGFEATGAPPKEKPPTPTESSLAVAAATGDKNAIKALEILRKQHPSSAQADLFGGMVIPGAEKANAALTGDEFLKTLTPDLAGEVKAYAEGKRPFPTGISQAKLQPLIRLVGQYDPSFDAGNYNARNKARADLTSTNGTGGKQINALNTALQHASGLSDLIETLDNSDTLPGVINGPLNLARTKLLGDTAVTNFKARAPQLVKEIQRLWSGAGGSRADVQELLDSISPNMGRQQQREALQQFIELAQGKLDSLQQQRDNVLGPKAGADIPILYNQNKAAIDKINQRASGNPSTATQTPMVGTEGTVNGVPAVWKNGDKGLGWYAK